MFAVQHKETGQLVDLFPTLESANVVLEKYNYLEVVSDSLPKLEVWYTELGGPNGYGTQSPEFTTYGSIKNIIIRLKKFEQRAAPLFGPDARDIKDYLKHCHIYINGHDFTEKWLKYIDEEYKHSNKIFYA